MPQADCGELSGNLIGIKREEAVFFGTACRWRRDRRPDPIETDQRADPSLGDQTIGQIPRAPCDRGDMEQQPDWTRRDDLRVIENGIIQPRPHPAPPQTPRGVAKRVAKEFLAIRGIGGETLPTPPPAESEGCCEVK